MAEIQKKIKICPNGHPYDPSRFESCPICSNGGFAPTLDPFATTANNVGDLTGTTLVSKNLHVLDEEVYNS